jgi:hypothetical protein
MREHDWLKLSDLITREGHPSLDNRSAVPKNQANAQGLDADAQPQTDAKPELAQIAANIKNLIEESKKRSAVRAKARLVQQPCKSRTEYGFASLSCRERAGEREPVVAGADEAEKLLPGMVRADSGQKRLSDRISFLTGQIERLQSCIDDLDTVLNARNHRVEALMREKSQLVELKKKTEESALLALENCQSRQQAATQEISACANTLAERDALQKRAEQLRLEIEQRAVQAQIEDRNRHPEKIKQTESAQPSIWGNSSVQTNESATQYAPDVTDRPYATTSPGMENGYNELNMRLQQLEVMVRILLDNKQRRLNEAQEASASAVAEVQAYPRLRDVIVVSLCSAFATLLLMLCLAFFIARNSVASTDYVVEQRPNNNRRRGDEEEGAPDAGAASFDAPVNRLLGGARLLMARDRQALLAGAFSLDRNTYTRLFTSAINRVFTVKPDPDIPPDAAGSALPSQQQPSGQTGAPPIPFDASQVMDSELPPVKKLPDSVNLSDKAEPGTKAGENAASKDWAPPPSSGVQAALSARKILLAQEKRMAVHVGPFDAVGGVKISAGYNDNLYLNSQPVSSWQIFVQPALKLNLEVGRNVYSVGGSIKQNSYPDSTVNNYLDRFLETGNMFDFGARHKLDLGGGLSWSHGMLGQFIQQGFASQGIFSFQAPVQYHSWNVSTKYVYGAQTAKGNLEFRLGYSGIRYDNYPRYYQALGRNDANAGVTFFYQVQPKTKLLAEFNNIYSNYPIPSTPALNSNFRNYLLGVSWRGTAKTTGTIKLGYAQKEFVSPGTSNVSVMTWHVGTDWEPFKYSKFSLYSNQDLLPSWSQGTTAINMKNTHLDWRHSWTGRIESKLFFDIGSQNYVGGSPFTTHSQAYGAEVNYQMHRWLRLGLNYTYTQRQSSQSIWTGDQNLFMLNVMLTPP